MFPFWKNSKENWIVKRIFENIEFSFASLFQWPTIGTQFKFNPNLSSNSLNRRINSLDLFSDVSEETFFSHRANWINCRIWPRADFFVVVCDGTTNSSRRSSNVVESTRSLFCKSSHCQSRFFWRRLFNRLSLYLGSERTSPITNECFGLESSFFILLDANEIAIEMDKFSFSVTKRRKKCLPNHSSTGYAQLFQSQSVNSIPRHYQSTTLSFAWALLFVWIFFNHICLSMKEKQQSCP